MEFGNWRDKLRVGAGTMVIVLALCGIAGAGWGLAQLPDPSPVIRAYSGMEIGMRIGTGVGMLAGIVMGFLVGVDVRDESER